MVRHPPQVIPSGVSSYAGPGGSLPGLLQGRAACDGPRTRGHPQSGFGRCLSGSRFGGFVDFDLSRQALY
eukprot:1299519-Lingulodinium_polyedra.AAC.1